MSANPVKKLEVWRTFSDASRRWVGTLAQNTQGVFFQYQPEYLEQFSSLSPFRLSFDNSVQLAPRAPHQGLQGGDY
jgi:serine/threonine-protein kinase HipA